MVGPRVRRVVWRPCNLSQYPTLLLRPLSVRGHLHLPVRHVLLLPSIVYVHVSYMFRRTWCFSVLAIHSFALSCSSPSRFVEKLMKDATLQMHIVFQKNVMESPRLDAVSTASPAELIPGECVPRHICKVGTVAINGPRCVNFQRVSCRCIWLHRFAEVR